MGAITPIAWCDATFNPWVGCLRVSTACDRCYAAALSSRYGWRDGKGRDLWDVRADRRRTSSAYWRGPLRWNERAQAEVARARQWRSGIEERSEPCRPETDIGESLSRCERLGKNQPGCERVHTSLPNARIDSLQTDTPQVGRRAVPLTLSTPLRQIGELRPEEADTTGAEGKTRLQALLSEILARSQDLGLDDRQIAGVSRMYWDQASVTADQAVSDLAGLLSAEQFRAAIGQYARGPAVSALAERDLPDKLDRLVNAAFDRATKDKSVVEIELAAKVADRLIGWAKTFAYFVAVPVAILFLILAVFGISKFEDVQKVADQANKILADTTASLDKGQKNLASAEQKLASLTQSVADIEQTTRQNSDKLAQLKHYLPNNYIEDFLKTTNKTVSDVKRKLKEIGLYHGDIDDKVDDAMLAAIVAFQEKNNLPADGLLGMGTYLRLFGSDHGPSASNTSHPADPAAQAAPSPAAVPAAPTAPSPAAVPAAPTAPGSGDAQTNR